jgi:hypothetical protein
MRYLARICYTLMKNGEVPFKKFPTFRAKVQAEIQVAKKIAAENLK